MQSTYRQLFRDLWKLVAPYWSSGERWRSFLLLGLIIGLGVGMVYINVWFNGWNGRFYNALQDKNLGEFWRQLAWWGGMAPLYIVVAVYRFYLRQMLEIRWRTWLTHHYVERWMSDRSYYRLQLAGHGTDNPDQRIAEDVRDFVASTLALGLNFLNNALTLFSFFFILWTLSGSLTVTVFGTTLSIPGYMCWVALVYTALGTWITHLIGRPLVGLNFSQQRYEADFRFSLIRIRENAEGIALYGGEASERQGLGQRFRHIVDNWWTIMRRTKALNYFTITFGQVANIFPIVVVSPRYFAGQIQLGGIFQTAQAFGQVQDAMSWFINVYTDLASWKATVDRLTTFRQAMEENGKAPDGGIARGLSGDRAIAVEGLSLGLPNGQNLLDRAALRLQPGVPTFVSGPSGSGKSTLFRALAGIWPYGSGRVTVPAGAEILFLPQKPYLPIGTLRHAVGYPSPDGKFADAAIAEALRDAQLPQLADRLDEEGHWAQTLSPGEQQRLAIARALLQAPAWLFLDEATSALDGETEAAVYRVLRDKLPDTTIVSIAHRPGIAEFHERKIEFARNGGGPAELHEAA
ncbi:MAG: ABC transporter ATP-binding protein/permease [Dongiaceae bacterium]